jgi:hypothetical protein
MLSNSDLSMDLLVPIVASKAHGQHRDPVFLMRLLLKLLGFRTIGSKRNIMTSINQSVHNKIALRLLVVRRMGLSLYKSG